MKKEEYRQKKQNNKITMKNIKYVDFKTHNNVPALT